MSATKNKSGSLAIKPARNVGQAPMLITGGAGFIGTNFAHRILDSGQPAWIYDNLSRPGVEQNWHWLKEQHGNLVRLWREDIRDPDALKRALRDVSAVVHFAAQVAVTTSLADPVEDFEINARGTLNLLEALRSLRNPRPLIYTSSNKIYGELDSLKLLAGKLRYEPADPTLRRYGFSEETPLQFHSPYGCSKGTACQYVLDYARTFGLKTVVFCMSCIYGSHQFGNEDQGWVAHFIMRALRDQPITIYGDGRRCVTFFLWKTWLTRCCWASVTLSICRGGLSTLAAGQKTASAFWNCWTGSPICTGGIRKWSFGPGERPINVTMFLTLGSSAERLDGFLPPTRAMELSGSTIGLKRAA